MKYFAFVFGVAILSALTAQILKAATAGDSTAYCAGQNQNVRVSLSLNLNNGNPTLFKLGVWTAGQPSAVFSSGVARTGGGDGMMWADLVAKSNGGASVQIARLTWWVVPTITPRISLSGQSNPIMLNCQNLWPSR